MRYGYLLILLFLSLSFVSNAQLGLQVGLNSSGYNFVNNEMNQTKGYNWGFNTGILYRTRGRKLCLQPTLIYSQKGADLANTAAGTIAGIEGQSNRLEYVIFSLPFVLKIPIAGPKRTFDVGLGPYYGKLVSAIARVKYLGGTETVTELKVGSGGADDFKASDMGICIFAGLRYKHFFTNIGYEAGLSNIDPVANSTVKNGCLNFNLGIFF